MNSTIVSSLLVATSLTYVRQIIKKENLDVRPLVGAFVLGLGLFGIGMASEELAKSLAIIILITSVAMNGTALFNAVEKILA